MKKINAFLAAWLIMAMVAAAFAQSTSRTQAIAGAAAVGGGVKGETLIKNATILTASHGTINNGSILVRDGKIAEIGPNVKARDPNARVIDVNEGDVLVN